MAGYIGSKAVLLSTTAAVVTGNSTVGGNLTVDTNTLFVDAANNRVGIGTSSPQSNLHVTGTIKVATGNAQGILGLGEGAGSTVNVGLWRGAANNPSSNGNFLNLGGYDGIVFATGAAAIGSQTERCRVDASGNLTVGATGTLAQITSVSDGTKFQYASHNTDASGVGQLSFRFMRNNADVGSITTTSSATSFNTSSDYRLKENVVPLAGAADRLAQIPVCRFNFIADPDRTVDGFLAHEVQAFVPECVTGEKDEVDDEGNPKYQGIDQSKLVPLLTAALQEALTEIQDLKARVATLEGGAA
jgi:hypothetical protein